MVCLQTSLLWILYSDDTGIYFLWSSETKMVQMLLNIIKAIVYQRDHYGILICLQKLQILFALKATFWH